MIAYKSESRMYCCNNRRSSLICQQDMEGRGKFFYPAVNAKNNLTWHLSRQMGKKDDGCLILSHYKKKYKKEKEQRSNQVTLPHFSFIFIYFLFYFPCEAINIYLLMPYTNFSRPLCPFPCMPRGLSPLFCLLKVPKPGMSILVNLTSKNR